jgi:hypothetical protein
VLILVGLVTLLFALLAGLITVMDTLESDSGEGGLPMLIWLSPLVLGSACLIAGLVFAPRSRFKAPPGGW